MSGVEIIYLNWNRRSFAEASFRLLVRNTSWDEVDRLVVYDDESEDGGDEWLEREGALVPVPAFELRRVRFRSPVSVMNDAFALTEAEIVAKVDNDIATPPGWLDVLLGVMRRHHWLDCLGSEAGRSAPFQPPLPVDEYAYETCSHIGGVGLIRSRAIRKPIPSRGRFGWTQFQERHNLERGWLLPDIAIVQLDRIPEEPWTSLAADYVKRGWSRQWPPYPKDTPEWWNWIADQVRLPAAA